MDLVFPFLLGLCIGSFLNVVIYQLEGKRRNLFGRSQCPNCQKILQWYELIPVVSFVIQQGQCRKCQKKISKQYPLVELATGILFVLFWPNILYLFFAIILIIVFVYDFKHYLIPDKIIYPAIVVALICNVGARFIVPLGFDKLGFDKSNPYNFLSAALIASGFFLILVLISKEKWLGWGDVKLVTLMGLILGWPNILLALLISFVAGAFCGIILIGLKKKTIKSQIPFGPFLSVGTLLMMWINHLGLSPIL